MAITRLFRNGNSQAVRIPAEYAFARSYLELEIDRVGDELRFPSFRLISWLLAAVNRSRLIERFFNCGLNTFLIPTSVSI